MIRKEVLVADAVLLQLKQIVEDSRILQSVLSSFCFALSAWGFMACRRIEGVRLNQRIFAGVANWLDSGARVVCQID